MGSQLIRIYEEAEALGGVRAKMMLASLTRITSTQAYAQPDTPERVVVFERAIEEVKREEAKRGGTVPGLVTSAGDEGFELAAGRLRHHVRVVADLMHQRALFLWDVPTTIQRVTEATADTLGVQRTSVWFYDERATQIRCSDLFTAGTGEHTEGGKLAARDFPRYFEALVEERTIAAVDAHTDPRTRELSAKYLRPLGISSMLDVPIWADGKMIGVVCHEHVGPARTWTADEESFAFLMGSFVALAIDCQRRASPTR